MNAMLIVGNDKETITVAKNAIIEVLKAAGTEAACVAAMNTLTELARAPQNTSITGCMFTAETAKAKKRNRS